MTRDEALQALRNGTADERRRAARWLARHAAPGDRAALARASGRNPDPWERLALDEAIGHLEGRIKLESAADSPAAVQSPDAIAAEAYARGLRDTTRMLVHELRRFVGLAKLSAGGHSAPYEGSELQTDLERLSSLLAAIETLGTASRSPRHEEFDLGELLAESADREARDLGVTVYCRGKQPLITRLDAGLIDLAVRAGLRNACEAVIEAQRSDASVVLTWGATDRDLWIAIIDEGLGPPPELLDPFEFAASSKDEDTHLGVGLAIARRCLESLGGTAELWVTEAERTTLELRWPTITGN